MAVFQVTFSSLNLDVTSLTVKAIVDPNHDITLWESGAIITYLIEQYNADRLLTYDTLKEKHHLNQWLHFQMSGQGPYWGTAGQ